MDTGFKVRSVQPVSIAPVRIEPAPARQTVASDLPDTQAVSAVAETAAVQPDSDASGRSARAALNTAIDEKAIAVAAQAVSKVVQDADTKELVFRKISPETGEVIGQFPDEAMLRLKAYNAQVRKAEATSAAPQTSASV